MSKDLDLLQGPWAIAELEVDGQKMPEEMLASAGITVRGIRFTSSGMGEVYKGTIELDESKRPHHLNMKFDAGPEKGNTNLCIYKLDGDSWTICIATRGNVRPARFATKPGTGFALETLRRGKPKGTSVASPTKRKAQEPSAAAGEFEGEWQMVSAVMNGVPMEKSLVHWVKRVTEGNKTSVYAGPQTMMQVEFTSDSSKSPKTIDYLNKAGSNKGKTQLGIYEFESGLLKICMAAPGHARPATFGSVPGDQGTLTIWKNGRL